MISNYIIFYQPIISTAREFQKLEFFKLRKEEVRQRVPKHSTGAYFLAIKMGKNYRIKYVGRSDTHLRQRLLTHVSNKKYTHFSTEITDTIFEAFRLECREWHNSFPLDNKVLK